MRETPFEEKSSLVRILGAGTLATLGVAMVLDYRKKSGKNDLSFSKMRLSP